MKNKKSVLMIGSSLAVFGLLFGQLGTAYAQEASNGAALDVQGSDKIVVTGSRIARSGFEQPTPTTTVSADDIAKVGAANVADALNQLPQLRASLRPSTNTRSVATIGKNLADLRGLGAQRTLVLVDGRRVVSTVPEGPVDLNLIPQILIDGVDIVTGGASAAYGSDAVAGVMNLRLLDNLDGVKATFQGGTTDHKDYRHYLASVAFGKPFADGRGQITFAAEVADNNGVDSIFSRDWSAAGRGLIANPAYTPTNDEPLQLLVDSGFAASNQTKGGLIVSGPLAGIQFGPNGDPIPFNYGELVTARTMIGGDGPNLNENYILAAPVERRAFYGRASYEFSPELSLFVEGNYGKTKSSFFATTRSDLNLEIDIDNAFLPESIRDAMVANGLDSIVIGRFNDDYSNLEGKSEDEIFRGVIGAEGDLGGSWGYEVYYSHGKTDVIQGGDNIRLLAEFPLALDSIIDPVTGAAVCRDPAARAAGCVPINIFGDGSPSPEAIDYVNVSLDEFRRTIIKQDVVAATFRGDPFSTWAGPVSMAIGAEYRHDSLDYDTDDLAANFQLSTGNSVPWDASTNVKEAFAEAVIPLANDESFTEALDLNLAGRITDYSTSGTVYTWKAGVNWDITSEIKLRGTISRDIRAPSLSDLYRGDIQNFFDINDPVIGSTYRVRGVVGGNPDLEPEKATTKTIGLVFNQLVPGLRFSADFYDIDIDGALSQLSPNAIVQQCVGGNSEACALITRDSTNTVTLIRFAQLNFQTIKQQGVDLEADYVLPVGKDTLSFRAIASYVNKVEFSDGDTVTKLDGSIANPFLFGTNGVPHFRGLFSLSYNTGGTTIYGAARYTGSANIDNSFTSKDLNILRAPSITYFDTSITHSFDEDGGVEAFLAVSNVFDKDPPLGLDTFSTQAAIYDVIGRTYSAGIRIRM